MHLLKGLLKGRLLGHPVHLILVHFPAALFPFAAVLDTVALMGGDGAAAQAGLYAMAGGLAGGVPAAVFGAIDYFTIAPTSSAWKAASIHAGLNLAWLSTFAVLVALRLQPAHAAVSVAGVLTSWFCVAGMIVSNFLGGEVVLRHGIGLVNTGTEQERPRTPR